MAKSATACIKVTGYLELYDFIYVYIYATKTGILIKVLAHETWSTQASHIEETINVRTPAIIGRSYTETKPRRYWVMPLKGRWSPPYQATEKWSSIVNPRLR